MGPETPDSVESAPAMHVSHWLTLESRESTNYPEFRQFSFRLKRRRPQSRPPWKNTNIIISLVARGTVYVLHGAGHLPGSDAVRCAKIRKPGIVSRVHVLVYYLGNCCQESQAIFRLQDKREARLERPDAGGQKPTFRRTPAAASCSHGHGSSRQAASRLSNSEPILSVRDLRTEFVSDAGIVKAVDGVSFDLHQGETLAIVGESGCGKSVTALSIMRLIPNPPGRITGGQVFFEGQDLMQFSPVEMQKVRGARISMIFQEPMTSLNPVLTIGDQVAEPLRLHMGMNRNSSRIRAVELLEMVGIPDPHSRVADYPHQLSGGQRQRVMIAMALSCRPLVLIADEATTALDVTIQAQILELLMRLSEDTGTATIIITHNLGIVARYADRVSVMYAGKIREQGSAVDIYRESRHPYTVGLLNSVPRLDSVIQDRLESIEGEIPDLLSLPSGCAFQDRCAWFADRCANDDPGLISVGEDHKSACWEWEKVSPRPLPAGATD